jgi:HD-like signal output (HDOD) protein
MTVLHAAPTSAVDEALARILKGNDFPAFAQQMREVLSALGEDQASTQRVVNVVLRDYSLTLKLIRVANSVHYNRTGRPIRSATHALLLLGARTARAIASSLLLFEQYQGRSRGLKELMLLSLLTANHARELATRVGLAEAEEAHLAGMFRNLGEVLVAAHFPEAYARVLGAQRNGERTSTSAAFAILGYHYEELGEAMARHWGMPDTVRQVIRARTPVGAGLLASVTALSHDLTQAIYRADSVESEALEAVVGRYQKRLGLSSDDVRQVLEAALRETREVFAGARASLYDLRLTQQTEAALAALGVAEDTDGTALAPPTDEVRTAGLGPMGTGTSAALPITILREQLLADLNASVSPSSGLALDKALLVALEALLRGGPFDRAAFAVANPERTVMQGRFGLGIDVEALVARLRIPMSPRGGPLAAALLKREDIALFDERSLRPEEQRAVRALGARGVGVFPLVVDATLLGCLYVDRLSESPRPDTGTFGFIREVRQRAAQVIDLRRTRTPTSDIAAVRAAPTPVAETVDATGITAESKAAAVIRLLRGEPATAVAPACGVSVEEVERWQAEFLAGAIEGLRKG